MYIINLVAIVLRIRCMVAMLACILEMLARSAATRSCNNHGLHSDVRMLVGIAVLAK